MSESFVFGFLLVKHLQSKLKRREYCESSNTSGSERQHRGCSLLTQEDGAQALAQQGEVGVGPGLHQHPVTEEDKGDGPREGDVEPLARSLQDLLPAHSLVARVDRKRHARVAGRTRTTRKLFRHDDIPINNIQYNIII